MAIQTKTAPQRTEEVFDTTDRAEIKQIIANLKQHYTAQQHDATVAFNRAQHEVNRTQHELSRLERHLQRINDFCSKHKLVLDEE